MIQREHCEEYSCEARGMIQKGEWNVSHSFEFEPFLNYTISCKQK